MKSYRYEFRELPTGQIERDSNQPRKHFFNTPAEENKFMASIRDDGIDEPIAVMELEENRYLIIDGHRRYMCAQKLEFETVPCRVYPKMPPGELALGRYRMQTSRRSWKPLERSEGIHSIKVDNGFKTNAETAQSMLVSVTLVANALQLREQKMTHLELMEKYGLSESYRVEFVRLKPKIRKIRHFEVDDIFINLFERVQHKIIRSAKDFRKLGGIFLRATANEEEIFEFLQNGDMTVAELEQKTLQTGSSLKVEQLMQEVGTKQQEGQAFTEKEKLIFIQFRDLLLKIWPLS